MATILQFTPQVSLPPVIFAPNVAGSLIKANPQPTFVATPAITQDGSPVVPSSLTILTPAANGTAAVVGVTLHYTPNLNFDGVDVFTYKATVSGIDSNVGTATMTVVDRSPCDELGRTTRTYVSAYSLSRQAVTRVRRSAKRCVVANFNGALPKGRTIQSVRWETTSPWSLFMENPRITLDQRQSMVDVTFNFAGWGGVLCTATLDNGELYNAEFSFTVIDSPLYPSATYPTTNGPYRLDASV